MSDADYFAARERTERALAHNAPSAQVRDIHLMLADKYAELAAREKAESAENENDVQGRAQDAG